MNYYNGLISFLFEKQMFCVFGHMWCIYFSYDFYSNSFPSGVTVISDIFDSDAILDKLNISLSLSVYVLVLFAQVTVGFTYTYWGD